MPKCGIRHTHFQPLSRAELQQHLQHIQLSTHTHTHSRTEWTLCTQTLQSEGAQSRWKRSLKKLGLLGGDWTVVIDDD